MLQRGKDSPLVTYGFLLSVEILEGGSVSTEQVTGRLKDALFYMEDTGEVSVESLGKIDIYDEESDEKK